MFLPAWCGSFDLDGDGGLVVPSRPDGTPYRRARVLVRRGDRPVGFVDVELGAEPVASVVCAAAARLPAPRPAPCDGPGLPADVRPLSVVVATFRRPEPLARCVASVLAVDDERLEVVVVDNSPDPSTTAAVLDRVAGGRPGVRLVHEPRQGVSRARNRGAAAATGSILAFIDDDVVLDPAWARGIRRGFSCLDDVGAVTGMVPSAELETEAQGMFDAVVQWSTNLEPRVYLPGATEHGPLYPFDAGLFGTGANVAVDARAFAAVGGYDVALGPGTPARAGEDLDLFVRLLLAGHPIVYEPGAVAWHTHRRELDQVYRQVRGYGTGLAAYAFKMLTNRRTGGAVVQRIPAAVAHRRWLGRRARARHVPRRLRREERLGMLAGPVAYWRGRWDERRST